MITYAGTPLLVPDAEDRAQLSHWLRPAEIWHFIRRHWPGFGMDHLPFQSAPEIPFEINRLYWPTGASRWGVFWGLVDRHKLEDIRASVFTSSLYQPANLSITADSPSATGQGVDALMWMLPVRPIYEIGEMRRRELSLITLVDERFFWWLKGAEITVNPGTTTWENLYGSIATGLDISLSVDPIPAAYLKPSGQLSSSYGRLPTLLDAVAYSVGQRIVRQFDGTVRAWSVTESDQTLTNQLNESPGLRKLAGGVMDLKNPRLEDIKSLLPARVLVVFPRSDDDVPTTDSHVETVTLLSLELPEYPGIEGYDGEKVIHVSALATYESSSQTNGTETEALAEQIATDWYRYQQARLDIVLDGIKDWDLTGLDDCYEHRHQIEGISTRIKRIPWNDTIDGIYVRSTAGESGSGGPDGGGGGGGSIIVADDEGEDTVDPCHILLVDNSSFDVTEPAEDTAHIAARFASVGLIQPVGAAADAGTSDLFARADHVHSITTSVVTDIIDTYVDYDYITNIIGVGNPSGQSILATTYNTTTAYADTGLSVSLPGAGTYLITAKVAAVLDVSASAGGANYAQLYNATDGAAVTDSDVAIVPAAVTGVPLYGSATITHRISVAAAKVIKLYAKHVVTGTVTASQILQTGSGFGVTTMQYVQLD